MNGAAPFAGGIVSPSGVREDDFGAKRTQATAESGFVAAEGAVFDLQSRVRVFNRAALIASVEGKTTPSDGRRTPVNFQRAAAPSRTVADKAAADNIQAVRAAGTGKIDAAPAAGASRIVSKLAVDYLDLTVAGINAAAKVTAEPLGKGYIADNQTAFGNGKNVIVIIAADGVIVAFNDNLASHGRQRFGQRDIDRQREGVGAAAGRASTDGGILIGGRNRIAQTAILVYRDAGGANLTHRRGQAHRQDE